MEPGEVFFPWAGNSWGISPSPTGLDESFNETIVGDYLKVPVTSTLSEFILREIASQHEDTGHQQQIQART